jgi:hypothetical protein
MTHNTTVSIKTNSLTIFVPSAFCLIRWCCCSKQKSSGELQISHHAKTSRCTTAVCDVTNTASNYVAILKDIWQKWGFILWRGILQTPMFQLRIQIILQFAARFKACIGCRSPAEIGGSNPTGDMDVRMLCVVFVISRVLCGELITHQTDLCRLWCVAENDLQTSWISRRWPIGGYCTKN